MGAAVRSEQAGPGLVTGSVVPWVVSPHLLVAQAVSAALASAGATVDVHAWEDVLDEARARHGTGAQRCVVVIVDDRDGPDVVEEVARWTGVGGVRVAVVAPDPAPVWWGRVLEGEDVDLVTSVDSLERLAEVVARLVAGHTLMDLDKRIAARSAWVEALDSRRRLIELLQTLSPQQRRVLELLADGHQVHDVADVLGVAVGTVRSHVKALRARLGVRSQLEAVALLRRLDDDSSQQLVPRPRGASAGAEEAERRR